MTKAAPDTIERVERWIREFVVGLDICPFARAPWEANQVHLMVSPAKDLHEAFTAATEAVEHLMEADPEQVATLLLILPVVNFATFEHFLDLVAAANDYLDAAELRGELQLAHFHPAYALQGYAAADHAHFLGRAPYPILHLLRESDVAAAASYPLGLKGMLERNLATVRGLSLSALTRLCGGGTQ
jgi:hypothetical protein